MSDALLSLPVAATTTAIAAATVTAASLKIAKDPKEPFERKLPLMAAAGGFVFAAQMINFAIPGTGSSGHLVGALLLSVLLGAAPALLTMTAILMIQCLVFADGGVLALGANIINMAIIPCLLIYPLLVKPLLNSGKREVPSAGRVTAVSIFASIISLQVGAFLVCVETTISGISALPFATFLLFMQPIHLAIGAVEGVIMAAVLVFLYKVEPELRLAPQANRKPAIARPVGLLVTLAILVGGGLSLLASANPDGLEWSIAKVTGSELSSQFPTAETWQLRNSLLPDYTVNNLGPLGTTVSGLIGVVMMLALAALIWLVITALRRNVKTE